MLHFLMLAVSMYLVSNSPGSLPYNCFSIPVFLGCLFFRRRAVWIITAAFPMLIAGLIMHGLCISDAICQAFFELFKWCVAAIFTLVAIASASHYRDHEMLLEKDIDMARALQKALIPADCEIGRVRLTGLMRQCRTVGGDFYYFRPFQEKYIVFCLGDVMGKGVPASMVMSVVMSFFFEWGKKSSSPSQILSMLDGRLLGLWNGDNTRFTTLFYCIFNEEDGTLTYAAGGHDTALVIRGSDGSVSELRSEGMPVGAFEGSSWEDLSIHLDSGDRVVLFSDGLTEARGKDGKFMGLETVKKLLNENSRKSNNELMTLLQDAVERWNGAPVFSDDLAILIMEVKPNSVWRPKAAAQSAAQA